MESETIEKLLGVAVKADYSAKELEIILRATREHALAINVAIETLAKEFEKTSSFARQLQTLLEMKQGEK